MALAHSAIGPFNRVMDLFELGNGLLVELPGEVMIWQPKVE
jgi:hypothetical protein